MVNAILSIFILLNPDIDPEKDRKSENCEPEGVGDSKNCSKSPTHTPTGSYPIQNEASISQDNLKSSLSILAFVLSLFSILFALLLFERKRAKIV
jgi:hypothetical protein